MTLIHSLSNLEEQLHYHLSLLRLPEPNWPPARTHQGHAVYDVVIVGAGMSGACAAAALKLQGIHNIALFDAAPAHQEGPWATFARMDTLRSPKELRSEEHTSELQSRGHLVCRLLLEKKKIIRQHTSASD